MTVVSKTINPWGAHPRPRPLSAATAEKRREFERFSECFDFQNFNAKMTVVSRAIDPWGAHPRPQPRNGDNLTLERFSKCFDFHNFNAKITVVSRAAAEKRRQFERFSKCFDFHNFNAKITLEIRRTNVGCLRPHPDLLQPVMTSNDL